MTPRSIPGLVCLWLLAIACMLAIPSHARQVEGPLGDVQYRHRRSLLGASTQQISQCEWIAGEGCALHPSFVSYTLNRSSTDVVARYVANALSCANVLEKGACDAVSYCYWDPAFTNGQQGCFLHDSAMLALQQPCVKAESQPSLGKLQACMAARHSCQCDSSSSSSDASSTCQLRQQQLLTGYRSSSSKVCQSLLGCWLSSLNGSSPDIMQLVEVQLALVQPNLEVLKAAKGSSSSGTSSGRRRALLQVPSLSDPFLDDSSSAVDDFTFESGSYSNSNKGKPSKVKSASTGPSVGMNGVILSDDRTYAPTPVGSPVEYGKNIPGVSTSSGAGGGMNPAYQFENGAVDGTTWESAPVDPDKVFGDSSTGSSSGGSSGSGGSGSSAAGNGVDVQMSGGNAPASFWMCAATAAVKADTTRKWADVDYNSKSLTLATWIKVIQPTALIDWGVQVMECFKAEVSTLSANAALDTTKPNKESMEYAIVGLIRSFSALADTFRTYLQAGPDSRATAGLSGLKRLTQQIFPDQLDNLMRKYNSTHAYDRDVMLQAAALIADMQWFSTDAAALAASAGSAAAQQQVFEAVVSYGEEMMRRCLYWMFHVQFEGPPAHLPGVPASTAASSALMDAFDGLAAATFPAPAVAADAPRWQQLQSMMAVAAGWAANAATVAKPVGGKLDAAALLGNAMDGLAKAHVQDFWATRVELARAGAPDSARKLALMDPNQQAARWQPLRERQVALLGALQQQVAAGAAADDAGVQQLAQRLRELVAASSGFVADGSAATQQQLLDSMKHAAWLASLIRQCHGSPMGLKPYSPAAAAAAGVPAAAAAACSQLAEETSQMSAAALPVASDVLLQALAGNINRQWACNGLDVDSCSTTPGCQLALAGTLVPGSAATAPSNAAANAELLLEATSKSELVLVCQAADAGLLVSSLGNSSKSALAANPTCEAFLQLPACEGLATASSCNSYSACRWELSSDRNLLHTVGGNISAAALDAAPRIQAVSKGVCAMDWVEVLSKGSAAAYSGLESVISLCSGISDTAACSAQTMLITLDTTTGAGGSNMARIWVPALVVAAVLGVVLFGAAVYWRRKSTIARRAAEEARTAGSGGSRGSGKKGGKDGKDGKAKGKVLKKKVKRAEPGQYKPDLMRDSFTDYMRSAPQQFENGVALAKAAMAAGSLDAAVAAADVAGGRQIALTATAGSGAAEGPMQPQQQQQMVAAAGSRGLAAPRISGSLPPLPPMGAHFQTTAGGMTGQPAAATNSDLIDLQDRGAAPGALLLQQQQQHLMQQQSTAGPYPMNSMMYSGPVWGSAAVGGAGANRRISGGGFSAGLSGGLLSGGLSGEVDLIDTGASLALTSSLGLVSSVPHPSGPLGMPAEAYMGAQQTAAAAAGPEEVRLGLPGLSGPHPSGRVSQGGRGFGVQSAATAAGAGAASMDGANSGSLLLGGRASGDIEDGASTPTSSCCHDSVCTFRHGAGSTVGSAVGSRQGGLGSASSSWRSSGMARNPSGSVRGGSASGAASGTGPSGLTTGLSGALSGALSRSSWSSAISTDLLMSSQPSVALDP